MRREYFLLITAIIVFIVPFAGCGPAPDLAITCISKGNDNHLWISIENLGPANVPETTFHVHVFIDGTRVTDVRLNSKSLSFQTPGRAYTFQGPSLAGLSAGSHTVRVVLDATSVITEVNETNNSLTYSFTSMPKLKITSPVPDPVMKRAIIVSGRTLTLNVTAAGFSPASVELLINDKPVMTQQGSSPFTFRYPVPAGLKGREIIFDARARDGSVPICSNFVKATVVTVPAGFDQLAGEYFLEMMLNADTMGTRFIRTCRFLRPPVFYFKNGVGTQGETQGKTIFEQAVSDYTGGRWQARFHTGPAPTDPNTVVTVEFTNTNRGEALPTRADHTNGGGFEVTGGKILLHSNYLNGFPPDRVRTAIHELGHVMIGHGYHTAIYEALMAQSGSSPLKAFEKAAWDLHYQLPVGTTLNSLQSAGIITNAMLNVKPFIVRTYIKSLWPSSPDLQGKVGETIYIFGRRFHYKFGCGSNSSFPAPVVSFNGVNVSGKAPTGYGSPALSSCDYIEVVIPPGARSGALTVTVYGETSNAVQFTVL